MDLCYFHVIETSLQGLLTFRPGSALKVSSVNEWLTKIIKELFDDDNVFRAPCGFAWF